MKRSNFTRRIRRMTVRMISNSSCFPDLPDNHLGCSVSKTVCQNGAVTRGGMDADAMIHVVKGSAWNSSKLNSLGSRMRRLFHTDQGCFSPVAALWAVQLRVSIYIFDRIDKLENGPLCSPRVQRRELRCQ